MYNSISLFLYLLYVVTVYALSNRHVFITLHCEHTGCICNINSITSRKKNPLMRNYCPFTLSPPAFPLAPKQLHLNKLYCMYRQACTASHTQYYILKREQSGYFALSMGEKWRGHCGFVVLLFCCPVFFSSFIQSCKAAAWCHQSQSACTSCSALIGCNDLRMSLHTLICFSL